MIEDLFWRFRIMIWFDDQICITVAAIGKSTSAVLWSKGTIFREMYCSMKMPPCHWAPQAFMPHISTFERGVQLFFRSGSSKVTSHQSVYFLSKTGLTFLLWLITFEPLEQKQSYIPLLKVLMCGMNVWGAQWHGGIFILRYTSLKMVLLLHKTAFVNFPMATTVGWTPFLEMLYPAKTTDSPTCIFFKLMVILDSTHLINTFSIRSNNWL